MAMHDLLPVWIPEHATAQDRELATAVAGKWRFPLVSKEPDELMLIYEQNQLQLKDNRLPQQRGVSVDFLAADLQYRCEPGGGKREPIAKAVGLKGGFCPTVIDATPGLGRDAYVLAVLGCKVFMIERSSVVAALLEDGLRRLAESKPEQAQLFTLIHGNSIEVLASWGHTPADVVYLDPMFPHRKKAAAVKKEMKVFQHLLGNDPDANELLAPASNLATKRVVVKRPNSAEYLAGVRPSMAITSKKHRFDVYIK